MNEPKDRVPDLLVERLALGELSSTEAAEVRRRLGDTADARLEELRLSDKEILVHHPPARVAEEIRRRAGTSTASTAVGWAWLVAPAMLAAVALLAWVALRPGLDPSPTGPRVAVGPSVSDDGADAGPEPTRLKGPPSLVVRRAEAGELRVLEDGAQVEPGALLQVFYRAQGRRHGVVLSVDGAGTVTLHFPAQSDGDTRLTTRGETPLPTSYELDDAPDFERFFFVASKERPVSVREVEQAAQDLVARGRAETGELALPEGLDQDTVLLRK